MTEPKLKCPCGKRHRAERSLRGATSRMSEALSAQAQLYAQMPTLAMDRPARDNWAPTPLAAGYQPMHIEVPPEMAEELRALRLDLAPGSREIWDPAQHPIRLQEARLAADRAMARARRRG